MNQPPVRYIVFNRATGARVRGPMSLGKAMSLVEYLNSSGVRQYAYRKWSYFDRGHPEYEGPHGPSRGFLIFLIVALIAAILYTILSNPEAFPWLFSLLS